jgi:hypothetical protein
VFRHSCPFCCLDQIRNSFLLTHCCQSDYVWDKATLDSEPDLCNQFVYCTDVSESSDNITPMTQHVFLSSLVHTILKHTLAYTQA